MSKKILSIIYFFPPLSGSGVQRTLKFIKYLPQYGYMPVVETVKEGHNFAHDIKLLNEVPECVKIYRSNSGETLWLRNIIEKVSSIKNRNNKENKNIASTNNDETNKIGIKDKIFRYIELNFLIPDSKIRWYRHAIKNVDKILKEEDIGYIFSSSYPYTVHLIALHAKKKTNLPWIADFRDPWVGNVFMTEGHSQKRKKKEYQLESEVVKYADKIIMVTEPICEIYKNRYPKYKDKFLTITNGFDSSDYNNIDEIKYDKFTICYSGILTQGQNPETLCKAIENLIEENKIGKEDIQIKFIGFIIDGYRQLFENYRIKDNVEILPYMTHDECLRYMKGANINLIILADKEESKSVFTGKIFDYIGVEKPILGIMPQGGVASDLIREKGIGSSFNHGDTENVARFIYEIYNTYKDNKEVKYNYIEKCNEFDRYNLTGKLVEIFDEF